MKMSELSYTVDLDARGAHLVRVELRFEPGVAEHVDLALPAWCPGSYLIRDYARFVRDLEVVADDATPRAVHKIDKSTWRVAVAGARLSGAEHLGLRDHRLHAGRPPHRADT